VTHLLNSRRTGLGSVPNGLKIMENSLVFDVLGILLLFLEIENGLKECGDDIELAICEQIS
jgi:hypothetical protein